MLFQSQTYGTTEIVNIPDKFLEFYERNKHWERDFQIVVGTDSQSYDTTKIVSCVAMICEGHGGIFFYRVTRVPRINSVKEKLQKETADSIEIAMQLVDILENTDKYAELFMESHFSIHIDAGKSKHGKTWQLIPELVAWVHACGYDCSVKPDSYVASSIADKISK